MSSKEIAGELGIAKTSVDTYCNRARAKLGVGGRYEAARLLRSANDDGEDSICAMGGGYPAGTAAARAHSVLAPLTGATLRMLAAGIIATLAVGALLAGFHALDAMKPPKGSPGLYTAPALPAPLR